MRPSRRLNAAELMVSNCGAGEDSLRVPWKARRSNQPILKEISLECSLEGLMLKLKLQYFGYPKQRTDSLEKTLFLGKIEAGGEGDDGGWHHQLDGHKFEQALEVGDRQGSLVCYNS